MVRFCIDGHTSTNKKDKVCPVCGELLYHGCPKCKQRWENCCCDEWPVWCFVYVKRQVLWLLQNGLVYPNIDEGSIDGPVQTSGKHDAPGVSVMDVVSEVDYRLKRCGDAGRALLHEAANDYNLSEPAKEALIYCSGWWRKRMPFGKWRDQMNKRREVTAEK